MWLSGLLYLTWLPPIHKEEEGGKKRDLQLIFLHRWLMHHIFLIVQDLLLKVKLAIWRISTFFHMYTEQGLICSRCHFLYYTHVTLSPLVLMQVWLGLQRKCKQTVLCCWSVLISTPELVPQHPGTSVLCFIIDKVIWYGELAPGYQFWAWVLRNMLR